ncbi:large proline-rich protein BAG6-like [Megalops cyprinoides]|uniref:large proline-rich protein BAG6-like n=1 Tax=Megalops cyprinoides TaxID=118141 RepID=UPI0018643488|nr:large proline-rich protein BAG6-like [Megalops cyprinoides]
MKKALQCDEAPPLSETPPSCPSGVLGEEEPGGGAGDWAGSSGNGVGSFWEESGESAALRLQGPAPGPQEGRLYHARLLQLLSTPRKRSGSACERPHPPAGTPAAWASLSGLRVMGSFKKLRSSVLQGIQNRGLATANQDAGPGGPANQDTGRDSAANQDTGRDCAAYQHWSEQEQRVSNGLAVEVQGVGSSPEGSDEEGGAEGGGLQRNSRCSRSIRMAYGVGRIPLQHAGAVTANGGPSRGAPGQHAPPPAHDPAPGPAQGPARSPAHTTVSAKVLSKLSRSTDNLHLFRSPFKRKPPSQPGPEAAAGPLNIKRAASASSVAPRGQSPLRASGRVRKLVSSLTDLSVRHRAGPAPCAAPCPAQSALSRLHDDYSRRAPCFPDNERQRRASPARGRARTPADPRPAPREAGPAPADPAVGPSPVCPQDCAGSGVPQGNTEGHSHSSLLQPQGALCQQTESWERRDREQFL